MYLEEYTKEDLIKAYKSTLQENQNLHNQLVKVRKELKELISKFKTFEMDRVYREPNQKRFSIR
jgi:dGTP triphosphohydrolase